MAMLFDEEQIREILKPLQQQKTASVEYVCQYKAIEEFSKRLYFLESLHEDIFHQISKLDKCLKR